MSNNWNEAKYKVLAPGNRGPAVERQWTEYLFRRLELFLATKRHCEGDSLAVRALLFPGLYKETGLG
jgi:hypothetical protein